MKKNRRGALQQRLLVIASVGIFMLERRMFPRGLSLSRMIHYGDLLLVRLDESMVEFFGPKVTIACVHEDYIHIAAIVRAVKTSLFSEQARPTKVVIEAAGIQQKLDADDYVFRSESVLADRFLSLSLSTATNLLVPDQLNYLYDLLKTCSGCFQFDAETAMSPLIGPVSLAIAYDEHLEGLRLWDLNFPSFMRFYMNMVQFNSSIHRVTFSSVSWNGPIKAYADVWNKKTQFAADQMTFNGCQLSTPTFRGFLEAFEKYPADMTKLAFIRCSMSKESLEALFESLYVARCFRTLADLTLVEVKPADLLKMCIMQFLSSNFMLNQKYLNLINFSDCNLDLDFVLPFFFKFETCLQSLTLAGNTFTESKGLAEINDFQNVAELTLSNCTFTGEVLLKFFHVLAAAQHAPTNLVLDSLKIDESGWDTFYEGISDVQMKSLKLLSWSNNVMNEKHMQSFKTFLLKQPTLTDLGLSNSISFADADACLGCLVEIVTHLNIERLELRATSGQTFGVKLVPFIQKLFERKTIKMLDISGQGIGDIGLDIITQLAETCLEELRFDGNSPSSYEVLLDRVKRITVSQLACAEWPSSDAKEVTAKISLSGRQQIMRQIEAARKEFEAKMARHTSPSQDDLTNADDHATSRRPSILTRGSRKESMAAGTLPVIIDETIIGCCEPWVTSSLNEIFNNKKIRDPLLVAVDELDAMTSLTHFLKSERR